MNDDGFMFGLFLVFFWFFFGFFMVFFWLIFGFFFGFFFFFFRVRAESLFG